MMDRTEDELRRQNAAYRERFEGPSTADEMIAALRRLRARAAATGGVIADRLVAGIDAALRELGGE